MKKPMMKEAFSLTPFGGKVVAALVLIVLAPFIYFGLRSIKRGIEGQPAVSFFIVVFIAPPIAAAVVVATFFILTYILQ